MRRRSGCTSHVERQTGTMRQFVKRLTGLTYAFSNKWDSLRAALAVHFAHCNFWRIGKLRVTPAMEADITMFGAFRRGECTFALSKEPRPFSERDQLMPSSNTWYPIG